MTTRYLPRVGLRLSITVKRCFLSLLLLGMFISVSQPAYAIGCSVSELINAINAANASSGNNTIELAPNCTYTLTSVVDQDNQKGLPLILNEATSGTLTINGNNAVIERSSASGIEDFGIVSTFYGNLTLNNLTLRNGRGYGGAINNYLGRVRINHTTISNNETTFGGGGIGNREGRLEIFNSTIASNRAYGTVVGTVDYGGGAISDHSGTVLIVNSTIANNYAAHWGGGIYSYYGSVTIVNSTIADNTADRGGGIVNIGANISLGSTIVANNSAAQMQDIWNPIRTRGYNLIGTFESLLFLSGDTATDLVGELAMPMNLGVLAENGGETLTMALGMGSRAIGREDAIGS